LKEANGSSSVIYLSFGSIIRLDSEQIVQISDALSSYPVIWSLKATSQIHLTTSFKENQSHLILDWAPQRLIVLHPAIRLFISHGSWNSLLEAMSAGKPMLVWPRYGDQFRNAKRVEHQFKIGRMIENTTLGTDQRVISADELTKYLKEIFNREKIYLEQAQLMKQIISNARENTSRQHLEEIINLIKKPEVSSSEKTEEL
jgi:UDP:flavonoid glycosyltransferase YjiC (YdhE family)